MQKELKSFNDGRISFIRKDLFFSDLESRARKNLNRKKYPRFVDRIAKMTCINISTYYNYKKGRSVNIRLHEFIVACYWMQENPAKYFDYDILEAEWLEKGN